MKVVQEGMSNITIQINALYIKHLKASASTIASIDNTLYSIRWAHNLAWEFGSGRSDFARVCISCDPSCHCCSCWTKNPSCSINICSWKELARDAEHCYLQQLPLVWELTPRAWPQLSTLAPQKELMTICRRQEEQGQQGEENVAILVHHSKAFQIAKARGVMKAYVATGNKCRTTIY